MSSVDPARWSPSELLQYVRASDNQYQPGQEGFGHAEEFDWRYEPQYPLDHKFDGLDSIARAQWMMGEIDLWTKEGEPERFDDMVHEPIQNPIIVIERASGRFLWDGNHRVGASLLAARLTIPAVVGTPSKILPQGKATWYDRQAAAEEAWTRQGPLAKPVLEPLWHRISVESWEEALNKLPPVDWRRDDPGLNTFIGPSLWGHGPKGPIVWMFGRIHNRAAYVTLAQLADYDHMRRQLSKTWLDESQTRTSQ